MFLRALLLWVAVLLTAVPYGVSYLLTEAPRDQYAILITLLLFWVFGYWGVVGPFLALLKARQVFRNLEAAHAEGRLADAMKSHETADVAIDLIASENRMPRFLAARIYRLLIRRLPHGPAGQGGDRADAVRR